MFPVFLLVYIMSHHKEMLFMNRICQPIITSEDYNNMIRSDE